MSASTGPRLLLVIPLALLLALAGCSSGPGPGERRGGPAGARAKPPAPLAGQDSFFDGRILAEITVGTEGLPESGVPGGGGGERGTRGRRGGGGGGGNLNIAGAGGLIGGNISGGVPFGGGRGPRDGGERGGEFAGPRPMAGGGMGRPVMIHLRFTNHGAAAVTLRISDFTSPLGNFAVRPEQLALAPGQSLETEPMTSQLGGAFAETDATLCCGSRATRRKRPSGSGR